MTITEIFSSKPINWLAELTPTLMTSGTRASAAGTCSRRVARDTMPAPLRSALSALSNAAPPKASVAADDQQMTETAFMGVRGTRSQLRQIAGQQGLNVGYCVFCLRHASSSSDVWQNYTHLTCGFPCLMPAITSDLPALAQSIKDWGRELGFQQVGISGLDLAEHEQHLQRWLDAGYHGEMEYMGAHGRKRSHPDELVPGTLRVVSLRMDYLPGDTHMAQRLAQPEKAYISRYALGRDYHKLIRKRVQQLAERIQAQIGPFGFRAFVDSAPVLEKAIAEKAGLGWIGKTPWSSIARPAATSSSASCLSTCRCRSIRPTPPSTAAAVPPVWISARPTRSSGPTCWTRGAAFPI